MSPFRWDVGFTSHASQLSALPPSFVVCVSVVFLVVVDRPVPSASFYDVSFSRSNPFQTSSSSANATASSSSLRRRRSSTVELKLGVILPYSNTHPWSFFKVLPAIELAVRKVHELTSGTLRFVINSGDSQCSETYGPLAAIDMYLQKTADVFIGPACYYAVAPIARFSPHWNVPIVTAGALVKAFGDAKLTQYRLLTRTSSSYAKLGQFMVEVVETFNWTSMVGIVYQSNLGPRASVLGKSDYFFTIEGIYSALQVAAKERSVAGGGSASGAAPTPVWSKAFDKFDTLNFSSLLTEISQRARIVVLCASPDTVRDIMIEAAKLNFDQLGEYVFFNIDLFGSKSSLEMPWYRVNDSDENNTLARRAYQSVLTVTLRRPDNAEHDEFTEKVKLKAKENQGYDVYKPGEEVNSFVSAFHDAVLLYALAVNETIEAGIDPTSGSEVTKRMWNRTFTGERL